jgi:hypothetical protein
MFNKDSKVICTFASGHVFINEFRITNASIIIILAKPNNNVYSHEALTF